MNRKEVVVLGLLLLASFVGSVYADSVVTSSSSGSCNFKCQLDNLQKPVVNGNFTSWIDSGFPLSEGTLYTIGGGITNFGTRTALSVNMTLFWTINQATGTIQQQLGTFHLGDISGRNTRPFTESIIEPVNPSPFVVVNVNATFVWHS